MVEPSREFDELVRRAQESVHGGSGVSSDGYMFRGICYAFLALAVAIKEGKKGKADQTPGGNEVIETFGD